MITYNVNQLLGFSGLREADLAHSMILRLLCADLDIIRISHSCGFRMVQGKVWVAGDCHVDGPKVKCFVEAKDCT